MYKLSSAGNAASSSSSSRSAQSATARLPGVCPLAGLTFCQTSSTCATRPQVAVAAGLKDNSRLSSSKRLQQLLELNMEDGWSVQPSSSPSSASTASTPQTSKPPKQPATPAMPATQQGGAPAAGRRLGRAAVKGLNAARAAPAAQPPAAEPAKKQPAKKATAPRAPYMDLQSEAGVMGLALLQARLASGKASSLTPQEISALKDRMEEACAAKEQQGVPGSNRRVGGRGGMRNTGQLAKAASQLRPKKRVVYEDDDGNIIGEPDEDEDITDKPAFTLTIGEDETEFAEYDRSGNVVRRSAASLTDESSQAQADMYEDDDDDDEFDFGGRASGWGALAKRQSGSPARQFDVDTDDSVDMATGVPLSTRDVERLLGGEGAQGAGRLLGGADEEDEMKEWGLDELPGSRPQQTLMEQLGVVKRKKKGKDGMMTLQQERLEGTLLGDDATVQWGGTGINGVPAGADLAEQEALLSRMFKPHKVKELLEHQKRAYQASLDLKKGNSTRGKFGAESKLHRQLRIVAGSAANKRLVSSQGAQTRPMMEKVRAAIFNMILSQAGSPSELPANSRWLDIFAGTGSVGLEALSRGAAHCHFVEYDPWVTRNILGTNITTCGFESKSIVHTGKAETFLSRARTLPRFAGGAFDFISMCPPYLLVSYPELFSLLDGSPLIHEKTIMFVEYPKQLSQQVPGSVGPLVKVRDRKYGRTWIAVYAPPDNGLHTRGMPDDSDEEDGLEIEF